MYRFVSFVIILSLVSSLSAEPAFELSESSFNFGKVSQNIVVDHTFWIKSVGNDTLVITKVDPGCGCTKAPIEDTVLAPGDSTRLKIFFDTKRYKGYVIKKPSFYSNVSEQATFLQILAEPLPDPMSIRPVVIDPVKIDVSQFTETPRKKASFNIINKGSVDFGVTLVDKPESFYDIELPEIIKAGDTAVGMVIVRDDAIELSFQHSFTIEFHDDAQTRFTIPVRRLYRDAAKSRGN